MENLEMLNINDKYKTPYKQNMQISLLINYFEYIDVFIISIYIIIMYDVLQ